MSPDVLTELVAKITADAQGLKSGLNEADKSVGSWVKANEKQFKAVGAALTGIGVAITGALGLAGKAAMEAVESENLFTVSLGDNAKAARAWSEELGKALGLNTYELRKNVGVIYTMTSSMGLAQDEALNMAKGVTELANDMASFYNLPVEEAFNKIKSGLVGMPRPLQDLGIVINETAAQTWALKTGMIAQGEEMTNQQKVLARYGALMEQTSVAQGDLARTMDSPTNKLRILGSQFDELKIKIGENIMPIISQFMSSISNVVNKVKDWIDIHPELAKQLTIIIGAIGVLALVLGPILIMLPGIAILFGALTGPIGLVVIAVMALAAAGIWLWQNWDKVTMFFREAWVNIKQYFLEGIQTILDSLSNFTRFIPGLNSLVDSAREKISNMIESTKIEEDALRTEKALKDVSEAIVETTEIVELNTDATIEQTEAALENIKALEEQRTALEETTDRLKRMRAEYEYARSDAGRLNISVKDVTFALFDMGKTTENITAKFFELGEDADNVNKVMEAFGITAQQVKEILDAQKESVDALGDAYVRTNAKAVITPRTGGGVGGVGAITYGSAAERLSEEQGMSLKAAQQTIERYATNPQSEEFAPVKGIMEDIVGYAKGGFVKDTGLAFLHAGETVIPSNEPMGNVVINFTQPVFFDREDTMNRFVDKISKTLDRKYRLRFGGAYNG